MPTTGIVDGRLMRITLDTEKVIHSTSCSISINVEVRDTASKDIPNGWSDGETGTKSWTASCEGLFSWDDTIDAEARVDAEGLFDLITAGAKVALVMTTGVSGDVEYSGDAIITSLEKTFPNNENSTYSLSLQGAGPLAKATIV